MGKAHANMMQRTDGIECVAICDIDPERTAAAKEDFPGVRTYNEVEALNADEGVELIANVLPHSLHCRTTVASLKAGKHVIVKSRCVSRLQKRQR